MYYECECGCGCLGEPIEYRVSDSIKDNESLAKALNVSLDELHSIHFPYVEFPTAGVLIVHPTSSECDEWCSILANTFDPL